MTRVFLSHRHCVGCGTDFTTDNPARVRCKPSCHRTDHRTGKQRQGTHPKRPHRPAPPPDFCAIDGEGVTSEAGDHRYVLLGIGDKIVTKRAGLTFDDVLTEIYAHAHVNNFGKTYIGFYLGYDFAQWLKHIPSDRAEMLFNPGARRHTRSPSPIPFPVRHDGWEFDLMGYRRFKFRREGEKRWVYVCDAGPYWQCSLLKAIDPGTWQRPVVTAEEYAVIDAGKRERATAKLDATMGAYTRAENKALAAIMGEMAEGLRELGIKPGRDEWIGPGQAAASWLRHHNAITREELCALPGIGYPLRAAQASYYGGRFEVFRHGHIPGTAHEYDINSAYPAAIAKLPCLRHAHWVHAAQIDATLTLYRVTQHSLDTFAPRLQHRSRDGSILHPRHTAGWHWATEVGEGGDVTLDNAWSLFTDCDCPPPFAEVADLYAMRQRVGKNTPIGRAIKLVINSIYGKFAQSIGAAPFQNWIYASLITAHCRTQILHAIATHPHPDSLLMIATDGVYFAEPHPGLPLSDKLGEWEHAEKTGMTIMMPGLYWDDKARTALREGRSPSLRSRGIRAADLAAVIGQLDDAWASFDGRTWPTADVPVSFAIVSPKQALARGKWPTCGEVIRDTPENRQVRTIDADPVKKRYPVAYPTEYGWTTSAYLQCADGLSSAPYKVVPDDTGWDDWTVDGTLASDLAEMVR